MTRHKQILSLVVICLVGFLLLQLTIAWAVGGLGRCDHDESVGVSFTVSQSSQTQDGSVTIVHEGGDTIAANETAILINNQSRLWSELQPPDADKSLSAGDNVSITLARGDRLQIISQESSSSDYPLNPFLDSCDSDRNQILFEHTYDPATPSSFQSTEVQHTR